MSVGVMMYDNKTDQLISNYSFPVSTEEFFIKYWQTAIDELGIKRIQNGIECKRQIIRVYEADDNSDIICV